ADGGGVATDAIVFNEVLFQAVAAARQGLRFIAEVDAVFVVAPDAVVAKEVVGVLVAYGDAVAAVGLQEVVLEQAVFDAPAEVQAVGAVVAGHATVDDRPLRAAAGVDAQVRVVLAHAVADGHVVGLLEADAVARVVAHPAALDHAARCAVEIDAAAPAAIERHVVLAVALHDEVLDANALDRKSVV